MKVELIHIKYVEKCLTQVSFWCMIIVIVIIITIIASRNHGNFSIRFSALPYCPPFQIYTHSSERRAPSWGSTPPCPLLYQMDQISTHLTALCAFFQLTSASHPWAPAFCCWCLCHASDVCILAWSIFEKEKKQLGNLEKTASPLWFSQTSYLPILFDDSTSPFKQPVQCICKSLH